MPHASGPLVTVAMAVYNQAPYVMKAVRSVLAQSYRRLELLIADDGSTDGTTRILRKISDPRVRVLTSRRNSGKTARMNQLLRRARGAYLLEMDGDDWLEPSALAVLVRSMRRVPRRVALVYGDRRFHYGARRRRRVVIRGGAAFRGRAHFLRHPRVSGPRFYRAGALRSVGGWPRNYPGGGRVGEDLALMLRLARRYDFHHVSRVLYNVRKHGGNVTIRRRKALSRAARYLARRAVGRLGRR